MGTSFDGCSVEELTEAANQLHAMHSATHRQLLEVLVALEDSGAWQEDGASCMESWVVSRLGIAWGTAASWMAAARSLESLPALSAAFDEGALSWDKVRHATRVASPAIDTELAERLVPMTAGDAASACRHLRQQTLEEAQQSHRDREFGLRWDRDRSGARPCGWLPADLAAVVESAVDREAEQAGVNPETGMYDPIGWQRADALAAICGAALAGDAEPDRATVIVHTSVAALRDEGWAELANGVPIASETLRRLACDCRMQVLALDESGQAIVLSEAARTASLRMRRVLFQRDQGCVFPGCGRVRFLHAHHRRFSRHLGATAVDNLDLLCRFHHRLVHEGGWTYERHADGALTFQRPDGREYPGPGERLRDDVRERFPLIARDPPATGPPEAA
jgi:hypothetical protein